MWSFLFGSRDGEPHFSVNETLKRSRSKKNFVGIHYRCSFFFLFSWWMVPFLQGSGRECERWEEAMMRRLCSSGLIHDVGSQKWFVVSQGFFSFFFLSLPLHVCNFLEEKIILASEKSGSPARPCAVAPIPKSRILVLPSFALLILFSLHLANFHKFSRERNGRTLDEPCRKKKEK